jgi:DNA-binding transcriptional ArsR family regulator
MQSAVVAEDRIFQALAVPSRRAIFESLAQGEAAVKDVTARFDISQPAVSQHLAVLKEAGLVRARREGRRGYYRVEPRGMKPLFDWVEHYRAFWAQHVDRLERLLDEMDDERPGVVPGSAPPKTRRGR